MYLIDKRKSDNQAIRRDQETTRSNADKGYLHDLNKIDQEKVNADREKTLAEIRSKAERDGEIAQKVNLGFGNSTKIVQSIGALFDEDWIAITRDYDKDMSNISRANNQKPSLIKQKLITV